MKNKAASIKTASGVPGPALQQVTAQGRLEGLVLSMTLNQVFRNTTDENMEVIYTFPLAWGAVLLGMEVTLAGKRRQGQVMAKQEATERYEKAVESGDAPVMVEKQQGGLYSASVGSLKPGEELVIEVSYAQLLKFEQGRVRLTVPTTVAPRYGDAAGEGGLASSQVPAASMLVEYPFALRLDITGAMARAQIDCLSHSVAQQATETGVRVSLERKAWLDRDFVLVMEGLEGKSFAITGPDTRSGDGHAATLLSLCPNLLASNAPTLNVKILVDCSGSMAGDSIEQARRAVAHLGKLLGGKDTFSLSRFGSTTERLLPPMEASILGSTRLSLASRKLEADLGGTEMRSAVDDTFEVTFPKNEYKAEADVLLITDGEVWDAQEIVNSARASGHRIYALGVGSAPAESLLQELAEATGGACEMASPTEDMTQAIERMVMRMRLAQLVKAQLQVSQEVVWASPIPKRLVRGETVHLFIRTRQALVSPPALTVNGTEVRAEVLESSHDDINARLLAAQQAGLSQDKDEATAIALAYELVTEHTNLLLVFDRIEADKTDGMPALHRVEQMVPAGWGGTGTMRFYRASQSAPASTVGSVWRSNRASVASASAPACREAPRFSMTQSRMDQFDDLSDCMDMDDDMPFGADEDDETPSAQVDDSALIALAQSLIERFNNAAESGERFRLTVRELASNPNIGVLQEALKEAQTHVKKLVNAWACLLLWAHAKVTGKISQRALDLLQAQLYDIDMVDQERAMDAIEQSLRSANIQP